MVNESAQSPHSIICFCLCCVLCVALTYKTISCRPNAASITDAGPHCLTLVEVAAGREWLRNFLNTDGDGTGKWSAWIRAAPEMDVEHMIT